MDTHNAVVGPYPGCKAKSKSKGTEIFLHRAGVPSTPRGDVPTGQEPLLSKLV